MQVVGTDAQPFGNAGPEPLDEDVRLRHQVLEPGKVGAVLQVERQVVTAPVERTFRRLEAAIAPAAAGDPQHVRPEVGQDHAPERGRGQAGDLDDLQPGEPPRVGVFCAHRNREINSFMISLVPP